MNVSVLETCFFILFVLCTLKGKDLALHIFLKRIYLFQRQRSREEVVVVERDWDTIHPLIHSPSSCDGQDWARLKSGTRSFIRVSHPVAEVPSIWAIFYYLPRQIAVSWFGNGATGTWTCAVMGCQCYRQWFNSLYRNPGSLLIFTMKII